MDTQKTMEEKMNELTQKAKTLEISLHTVNNIDEVLEKLEKFALKKEHILELNKCLNKDMGVNVSKIKQLLYKEMLILAEESVKRSSTDLCDIANAMTQLAETIIKIQ